MQVSSLTQNTSNLSGVNLPYTVHLSYCVPYYTHRRVLNVYKRYPLY